MLQPVAATVLRWLWQYVRSGGFSMAVQGLCCASAWLWLVLRAGMHACMCRPALHIPFQTCCCHSAADLGYLLRQKAQN